MNVSIYEQLCIGSVFGIIVLLVSDAGANHMFSKWWIKFWWYFFTFIIQTPLAEMAQRRLHEQNTAGGNLNIGVKYAKHYKKNKR